LIKEKNYDTAFELVLAERNLNLISWLVSAVTPPAKGLLSQTVIISVIQQLTCSPVLDISQLDWIYHCLTELDPKDHFISKYINEVLEPLQYKIKLALESTHPSHKEEYGLLNLISMCIKHFNRSTDLLVFAEI